MRGICSSGAVAVERPRWPPLVFLAGGAAAAAAAAEAWGAGRLGAGPRGVPVAATASAEAGGATGASEELPWAAAAARGGKEGSAGPARRGAGLRERGLGARSGPSTRVV